MLTAGLLFAINTTVAPRPNIVLIMADDLGWGDTGYNGSALAKTPNLDAMAANGLVFERFYAAAPVCSPTRGSVLTGRHPYRYGVRSANVGHLPESELTIAEVLKKEGYRTGFFGKWHLGTLTKSVVDSNRGGRSQNDAHYSPPWIHGFDTVFATEAKLPTFDPMIKPANGERPTWWLPSETAGNRTQFGTHYWTEPGRNVTLGLVGDDTKVLVDRAVPFITNAARDRVPFFAVVWTHAPHLPVVASDADRAEIESDDPFETSYFGSILALDRQVGRIREVLRETGVADNTIVWFMSDNGPEHNFKPAPGSSGGLRGAKRSLYEGGIRVPGIIEWPDQIPYGSTTVVPAVTSDVLPTILDYLGLSAPDERTIDGTSLKSVLSGDTHRRSRPIGFESGRQVAWIDDRFKLYYRRPPDGSEQPIKYELYDLRTDPSETTDISNERPEIVEKYKREVEAWRRSVAESQKRVRSRTAM